MPLDHKAAAHPLAAQGSGYIADRRMRKKNDVRNLRWEGMPERPYEAPSISKRQVWSGLKPHWQRQFFRRHRTTTSHNNLSTTRYQKTVGVGERWHKPFNGYPADDRLRSPHPVTRTHPADVGGPGASGLSLADALRRGPAASGDPIAILHFADLHLKSPD